MSKTDLWDIFNEVKILEQYDLQDSSNINNNVPHDFCNICNTNTLIYIDGNYYCNNCGLYQTKKLSEDTEYRYYGDADNKPSNPERVGMPTNILLPQSSLGSLIGYWRQDHFKKMIQYNSWNSMPYKERSQWKVFKQITYNAKKAGLPNIIIEQSKSYYKKISETKISRGSNRNGIIAACIAIACKKEQVPRSNKEIAEICGINLQTMSRGIKKFKEIWRLTSNSKRIHTRISNPLDYIDRFCSNLMLSTNIRFITEFVAVKAITVLNSLVEDNTAPSIAAGSIFLVCTVCKQNISKKQVSIACKISEVTISKCFKKLYKYRKILVPKNILQTYDITDTGEDKSIAECVI